MAKSDISKTVTDTRQQRASGSKVMEYDSLIPRWLYDFKVQAVVIAVLAFVFYGNTVNNGYALDDTIVIVQNEYVLEGISGIPDILTKDGYDSYYKHLGSSNQVSGGRYRPLSFITFAIEQQFLGAVPQDKVDSVSQHTLLPEMASPYEQQFLHNMHVRHFFNVLWFTLSVIVLLYFLRYVVFRAEPLIAFLAVLLFTIHPIHTEAIANVKSRDEILSLLFIGLTFIFAFKYKELNKKWLLALALTSYFLAFMSKEYAITLIALLPLSFYLFNCYSVRKSLITTLPYLAVVVLYVMIRLSIMNGMPTRNEIADSDIQVNPYAYASGSEKIATEIATSLNYLKLLIYPHPLSADYSYNQIPYRDFSSPLVWFSLVVHLGLLFNLFCFFKKRSVLCFGVAFYLFNLLLVNNFIFDIGATMGERLIYHSSFGFAIVLAWLLYKGMELVKPAIAGRVGLAGLLMLIIVLCGFTTIQRNKDWKSDFILFNHDINVVPNSFLVNANVASTLVNMSDLEPDEKKRNADLRRGVALFSMAIRMQDNYVLGYMNRAVAYMKLMEVDSMVMDLEKIRSLYPVHPQLPMMYYYAGQGYATQGKNDKAYSLMQTILQLNPGFEPARYVMRHMDSLKAVSSAADTPK
ncbi:MAG: bacteriophage receptor, outer rane subunit [Flavipsychrobacter sp.]|nr:bacteriophage receptor, outer rane subunit [Flavipsychrobacter sp.]